VGYHQDQEVHAAKMTETILQAGKAKVNSMRNRGIQNVGV